MTQNGVECIEKNQVESWLKENDVRVYTYVSDVKVNFSDKDSYMLWSVEQLRTDFDGAGRATFLLQINNVQISDEVWNPYK